MKAIQVRETGGPERLQLVEVPKPALGPGQALVKVAAAGVNFIDIYHRTGLYKLDLPFILGGEAAGTVEAVSPGVTEVAVGDRVATASVRGAYAEYCVVPAWQLVPVPAHLEFEADAAAMLQGMTAHYLSHSTWPLKSGDTCLIHAAAGGAGRLLVQMARLRGARIFGTVSTEGKARLAREAGADEAIIYTQQDFVAEVKRLTGGRGVDVVYDSVGVDTFLKGLDCLRPRGLMVLWGQASGAVAPLNPTLLNAKGSLFLTRPKLQDYIATREELLWRAGDVLRWLDSGEVQLRIERRYPLAEAAQAHRDLESRQTAGKLVLLP